tara:strand:+ start:489 stop:920 length:432 start_codon:yes stop_codon:yes gene_type:complete
MKYRRLILPFFASIAVVVVTGCRTIAPVEVVDLEPADAAALVATGEVAVLDVRTPGEYETAHIDGAVHINIRGKGFEEGVAKLDQSKPYLIHCAAGTPGGRSRTAVKALQAAGVKKIYHLNGGLNAWIKGNHPVKKGAPNPFD